MRSLCTASRIWVGISKFSHNSCTFIAQVLLWRRGLRIQCVSIMQRASGCSFCAESAVRACAVLLGRESARLHFMVNYVFHRIWLSRMQRGLRVYEVSGRIGRFGFKCKTLLLRRPLDRRLRCEKCSLELLGRVVDFCHVDGAIPLDVERYLRAYRKHRRNWRGGESQPLRQRVGEIVSSKTLNPSTFKRARALSKSTTTESRRTGIIQNTS